MVTEAARTSSGSASWSPSDFTPYLDVIFDWFGPERVMIGSDWPVCLLAASYHDAIGVSREYIERRFPAHAAAILGGTAGGFYGLR
jgi:L-fuconolactonase